MRSHGPIELNRLSSPRFRCVSDQIAVNAAPPIQLFDWTRVQFLGSRSRPSRRYLAQAATASAAVRALHDKS